MVLPLASPLTPAQQSLHNEDCDCPLCVPDSSQLEPVEISTGSNPSPQLPEVNDEPVREAIAFRHSFWSTRRPVIRDALLRIGNGEEQMKRFDACGCNCWVMQADDGSGRLRMAADRCHSRWCEACAAERRRTICRNLLDGLAARRNESRGLRFLTLTLKHNDAPLREQMDRLYACWRKLRALPRFKKAIDGGISFFEVKISRKDGRWHPHLHTLIDGDYLAKEMISAAWLKITGDSYIIDIKLVRNAEQAAGYIAKYAAKAIDHSVWHDASRLEEAMLAFRNRRTLATFGTFRRMNLSKPPEDDIGWMPIAPLYQIIARARAGDTEAIHILRQLASTSHAEPIDRQPPIRSPAAVPALPPTVAE